MKSAAQPSRYRRWLTSVSATLVLFGTGAAGEPTQEMKDSGLAGQELVQRHCTRCHLEPQPRGLPKEFWPMVLYDMACYVGMKGDEFPELTVLARNPPDAKMYAVFHKVANRDGRSYDPFIFYDFCLPQPVMTKAEWLRIKDYFVSNALPNEDLRIRRPKAPVLKTFRPVIPKLDLEANGWVLATAVDESRRRVFVGRAAIAGKDGQQLNPSPMDVLAFDLQTGKRLAQQSVQSLPVDLEVTQTGARLSTHGDFSLKRNERGTSQIIDWDLSGNVPRVRMLANGMYRLTEQHTVDMNGDGLQDIVVSAYGSGIFELPGGQLAVFWQTPRYQQLWKTAPAEIPRTGALQGALRETVLNRTAGIISATIADFNGDGRPDIAAMIAQGRQEIVVYINNGDETFTAHVAAELGPYSGGNSLLAADFNGDGRPDILSVYGDGPAGGEVEKGQISVAKPNHGIRLFENAADSKFVERLHYRMPGAVKAVAHDFRDDGHMDIAVIALYPDWSRAEPETFLYLENQGGWKFEARSLDDDAFGMWSSIEVADVNADRKPDIVLGLANGAGFAPPNWTDRKHMAGGRRNAPTVMFLINQTQ